MNEKVRQARPLSDRQTFTLVIHALMAGATHLQCAEAIGLTKSGIGGALIDARSESAPTWKYALVKALDQARERQKADVEFALDSLRKLKAS